MNGFDKLIAAFTIFKKYSDTNWPTHCEHDILYVIVNPEDVSEDDKAKLSDLGFQPDEDGEHFSSFAFGSA